MRERDLSHSASKGATWCQRQQEAKEQTGETRGGRHRARQRERWGVPVVGMEWRRRKSRGQLKPSPRTGSQGQVGGH